ncbi:S1 family peptidase [Streptomyces oceani]|uniref:Peptidase S1 domain-containing protein n=1 Tax=Streptomyces oceani TaxID=1075402 RepID=A0A1E7JJ11_9ACTN|nr:serine protease [Streptomyces oceani]OEU86474.1 hypothetical protein AN216_26180 [Streptomyces oceani]
MAVGGVVAAGAMAVLTVPFGGSSARAVAGGEKVASDREAPWMATLALKGDEPLPKRASCGGVLIAPTKVLTAAHCLASGDMPKIAEYHIGARDQNSDRGQVAGIAETRLHPRYELVPSPEDPDNPAASGARYDIAVVTLDRAVRNVPTLPLARSELAEGNDATLYGHGLTGPPNPDDPESIRGDVLRSGAYQTRATAECAKQVPPPVDRGSVLCAQSPSAAACTGDSGGPLVVEREGRREVAGVFSFGMETAGKSCGSHGPNFFADVAKLRSWVDAQLVEVGGAREEG